MDFTSLILGTFGSMVSGFSENVPAIVVAGLGVFGALASVKVIFSGLRRAMPSTDGDDYVYDWSTDEVVTVEEFYGGGVW